MPLLFVGKAKNLKSGRESSFCHTESHILGSVYFLGFEATTRQKSTFEQILEGTFTQERRGLDISPNVYVQLAAHQN